MLTTEYAVAGTDQDDTEKGEEIFQDFHELNKYWNIMFLSSRLFQVNKFLVLIKNFCFLTCRLENAGT
jgi:hypothetical protein